MRLFGNAILDQAPQITAPQLSPDLLAMLARNTAAQPAAAQDQQYPGLRRPAPAIGTTINGYTYMGGDPRNQTDPSIWKPAQGDVFLDSLPLDDDKKTIVKAIANYDLPAGPQRGGLGTPQVQQLLGIVKQYDPSFDLKNYSPIQKTRLGIPDSRFNQTALDGAMDQAVQLQSAPTLPPQWQLPHLPANGALPYGPIGLAAQLSANRQSPKRPDGQSGRAARADGAVGSAARAALSNLTFGLADPAVAGLQAVLGDPLNPTSHADNVIDRYHENLAALRGVDEADWAEHPVASLAGDVAGGTVNPAFHALPVTGVGSAIRQGAAIGAGYGLGRGVTNDKSAADTIDNMGKGALGGGLMGSTLHGGGTLLEDPTLNRKRVDKFLTHFSPDVISLLGRAGLFGSSAPPRYAPTPYAPTPYVPTS